MEDPMNQPGLVPTIPPGEDELPCCDGEPMETERHRRQMNLLIESLDYAWRNRDDVFIGGNMFVYYSELQVKKNDFRGPDVFVVLDTVRRERKSWVVWQENGRTPDVVIELVSESTEHIDRGEKMRIYARNMRVGEYYIYDPLSYRLDGFRLNTATCSYEAIEPDADGDLPCAQLGLRLGIRHGRDAHIETNWLRWLDTSGEVLPTKNEAATQRADEQTQRADEQTQRADEQTQRADEQTQRADEQTQRADEQTQRANAEAQRADAEARRADAEAKRAQELEARLAELEQAKR